MSDNLEPGRTDMFVPGPHDNAEPHEGVRESAPRVARSISNQPQSESEPRANKTRASLRSPRRSTPRARRMNLSLTHVNAWSVAKVTFMLSIAGAIIEVLAAALVWLLLDAVGVFDQLNNIVSFGGYRYNKAIGKKAIVLSIVGFLAIVGVVLVTLLATIIALLYNVISALVGGIHITLGDD